MTLSDQNVTDLTTYAGTWILDPARTSVEFHTKAMWVVKVKGTVKAIEGRADIGSDGALSGTLVLDATSFDTHNKKRDAHLRSKDFFAVAEHPHLKFELERLLTDAGGTTTVQGTLRIRGEALPITAPISIENTGPDTLRLAADFTVPHRGSALARTGSGWKKVPETLRIQAALTLERSR